MRSLIVLFTLFFSFGCAWSTSSKPSFLIVAVESLNSEAFYCSDAESDYDEGLGLFCKDGVRYTHAFAPSTMSQATLASIFTGLYPKDTNLRDNGPQYLSEKFTTVAETAFASGYRTAFFSGGPPIWRKSGLDQGFELFEDNLNVGVHELYRPAQKNFELFLNWLKDLEGGSPFFSVIFLSDLQFPNSITVNDLGEERARGFDSQLKEINESFASLAQKLKQQKRWDNTYVVIVGLNGHTVRAREDEVRGLDLHSDNTQVLLMIKPARKSRDEGLNWTIDSNVTLADLGATFYALLGQREPKADANLPAAGVSLQSSLLRPQVDWDQDRVILTESSWAKWRGVSNERYAIRQNNILYIDDERPQGFNTLTDRFETQPMTLSAGLLHTDLSEFKNYLDAENIIPFQKLPPNLVEKLKFSEQLKDFKYTDTSLSKSRLQLIIHRRPWDKQVIGWLAQMAINEKDWELLNELGEAHVYPIWKYIANRNQKSDSHSNSTRSMEVPENNCWALLAASEKNPLQERLCEDQEFILFADWVRTTDPVHRAQAEEKFFRIYLQKEIDEKISLLNFQNGLMWDTALDIPGEPRNIVLAFTLPEYKNYKQIVEQRIRRL